MTALTHVVVAAVAATRIRNLGLSVAVSAASHFALDAAYHFEALDQLGIPGRWTPHQALITVAAVSAVPVLAAMMWLWLRNRDVGLIGFYGLAFCLIDFIKDWRWQLAAAFVVTVTGGLLASGPLAARCLFCGFAAYLPDSLKHGVHNIAVVHEAAHFNTARDFGDLLSLVGRGHVGASACSRVLDPYYEIGYALELALEVSVLLWCFRLLLQRLPSAQPALAQSQRECPMQV